MGLRSFTWADEAQRRRKSLVGPAELEPTETDHSMVGEIVVE